MADPGKFRLWNDNGGKFITRQTIDGKFGVRSDCCCDVGTGCGEPAPFHIYLTSDWDTPTPPSGVDLCSCDALQPHECLYVTAPFVPAANLTMLSDISMTCNLSPNSYDLCDEFTWDDEAHVVRLGPYPGFGMDIDDDSMYPMNTYWSLDVTLRPSRDVHVGLKISYADDGCAIWVDGDLIWRDNTFATYCSDFLVDGRNCTTPNGDNYFVKTVDSDTDIRIQIGAFGHSCCTTRWGVVPFFWYNGDPAPADWDNTFKVMITNNPPS